jgi:hypothetical protein
MTKLREGRREATRPIPDEVELSQPSRLPAIMRTLGAVAVLVVGAVHLEQYFAEHFDVVPIIGPLFVLNFAGATVIGLGLLFPGVRMRLLHLLLALGGIALSATAFVFLFVSEHQPLFGFQDYGYRTEIVVVLAAEAAAVVTLGTYLATRVARRA